MLGSSVMLPHFDTNPVHEAKIQLMSYIRYTQHLAIVGDKFDAGNSSHSILSEVEEIH